MKVKQSLSCFCLLFLFVMTGCQNKRDGVKQSLSLNLYSEPPTLDSRKATDNTSMNVLIALFEGLTRIGMNGAPQPAMAEHIHISKDKTIYTFMLREAFWGDGHPVKAEDFVYAWRTSLDPFFPAPFAYKLYLIENAEAIKLGLKPIESLGARALDEKTLEVRLRHPAPYFLEFLAFPTFFPVPQHRIEGNESWSETLPLVSNGPFYLKTWHPHDEMILAKNPRYWDKDHVFLEKITFSMIDDTTTEFYMFEQGEIDWAGSPLSNLPVDSVTLLKEKGTLNSYPVSAVYFYKINTTEFPCSNVHIRKALALAINRKEIVDHILQGGQTPALGFVPEMAGWDKRSYFKDWDLAEANQQFELGLQELGLNREDFPTLYLCYNTNREHQKVAQAIQQQWHRALGIHVELENTDWKSYLAKLNRLDYQIGRSGWVGEFSDPLSFLQPFTQKDEPSGGNSNETGWYNPLYVAVLKAASYEPNLSRRAFLLREAEKILIDDMPIIPLYDITHSYVKKPAVKDVCLTATGFIDFKWAWIEEGKDP